MEERNNDSQIVRVEENISTGLKYRWEVEYSRFFNFPKCLSSISTNLKQLPKHRFLCGGTWMSSALLSSVNLIHGHDPSNSDTILVVYLQDNIVEQHFVCNLHFSWPQVSCDTECPPRGSRAVFASYRDCDSQMQKFAMRFKVASDAQIFMDFVSVQPCPAAFIEQESLTDKNEIANSETDIRVEISSPYEFVSPNGPCYRIDEMSHLNIRPTDYCMNPLETTCLSKLPPVASYSAELPPAATYSPKMPQIAAPTPKIEPVDVSPEIGQNTCSQSLSQGFGNICGSLPSSFSALLTTCVAEAGEGQLSLAPGEIDIKSQSMIKVLNFIIFLRSI